ncbi:DUF4238 domain-containing protein [Oxalicibacterium faecigallinarum]|uniref:DUF4238 domain-containing protein n=1 Tax=Oxalicibacterium faecigallinarum TaxID=573741 RepID=A0A8J3F041_9BURK|nr:DUF4238 domain-containing protein [Oxalicibacterium faecigallinarum]GGI17600.1 hypothetical protein GCM10008066_09790 [Oxalicibacterium faecigallinarum]
MNTTPKKKNQHFVPQFYFRYFNEKKKHICSYLISKKRIIENCSIADQASKSYFYGDGEVEDEVCEVENVLKKNIDYALELRRVDKKVERGVIQCIQYQDARTSKKRNQTQTVWKTLEAYFDISEKVKNIEEAKNWKKENSLENFDADDKRWQWHSMVLAFESGWAMEDLECILLRNSSQLPFVFSDAPAVFINPCMRDFPKHPTTGALSAGLIVVFPISPDLCFIYYDSSIYKLKSSYGKMFDRKNSVLTISEGDVLTINTLQFINAASCIYSADAAALLKFETLDRGDNSEAFECAIDTVKDTETDFKLMFHGVLPEARGFPDIPFFNFTKALRYIPVRPKALKKYKERNIKRLDRFKDKNFRDKFAAANQDEKMSLLRI